MANSRPYEYPDAVQSNKDYIIPVDKTGDISQQQKVLSDLLAPIGAVMNYAGLVASVPANWILCDGSQINRTTYDELFAIIGTTFGVGDGSTTFNVPDMKSRVVLGATQDTDVTTPSQVNGYGLGQKVGEDRHTLSVDEMPFHGHDVTASTGDSNLDHSSSARLAYGSTSSTQTATQPIQETGNSESHENRQPSIALYGIIKAY